MSLAVGISSVRAYYHVKNKSSADHSGVYGYSHRSSSGEPSLLAKEIPQICAPAIHQIPTSLSDRETQARRPHVAMLVDGQMNQILRVRSTLETAIMQYFHERGFTKVTTPILSAGAGGAVARPFETVATELARTPLNLRIAPELWLKRLIVGGMTSIYEFGPAFRNEGSSDHHLTTPPSDPIFRR